MSDRLYSSLGKFSMPVSYITTQQILAYNPKVAMRWAGQ